MFLRRVQRQARQPGPHVRRKHPVGLAHLGQHFALFKNDVVLAQMECRTGLLQRLLHNAVPRNGLGFVVLARIHGLYAQCLGQCGDFFFGAAVQNDEACVGLSAKVAQACIQLHQRFTNELHTPVLARQGGQNVCVEDKHTVHTLALLQGDIQCGVVVCAQVAAEPDQARGVLCVHATR